MGKAAPDLEALVEAELFRVAPRAAALVAEEILQRHRGAVASVLFYGSCLRRSTHEGVLDFYVLVDSYRAAYASPLLAWANAALPPNVFYLELDSAIGTLRAKYAVVSTTDFLRGARPGGLRPGIWARFCQPALAVYSRDDAARHCAVQAVAQSITTAVAGFVELQAARSPDRGTLRLTGAELWEGILHGTYASELRTEAPESIQALYRAAPERYGKAAASALARLEAAGRLKVEARAGHFEIQPGPEMAGPGMAAARGGSLRRFGAKLLYFLGLLKSAFTFGDWLPYVLWKLERHTGTRIVPSERQRRHPFIWGWPLLFRVLWQRDLR